jgi:hypothetical protein
MAIAESGCLDQAAEKRAPSSACLVGGAPSEWLDGLGSDGFDVMAEPRFSQAGAELGFSGNSARL